MLTKTEIQCRIKELEAQILSPHTSRVKREKNIAMAQAFHEIIQDANPLLDRLSRIRFEKKAREQIESRADIEIIDNEKEVDENVQ